MTIMIVMIMVIIIGIIVVVRLQNEWKRRNDPVPAGVFVIGRTDGRRVVSVGRARLGAPPECFADKLRPRTAFRFPAVTNHGTLRRPNAVPES